jgi:hypothetical protein
MSKLHDQSICTVTALRAPDIYLHKVILNPRHPSPANWRGVMQFPVVQYQRRRLVYGACSVQWLAPQDCGSVAVCSRAFGWTRLLLGICTLAKTRGIWRSVVKQVRQQLILGLDI